MSNAQPSLSNLEPRAALNQLSGPHCNLESSKKSTGSSALCPSTAVVPATAHGKPLEIEIDWLFHVSAPGRRDFNSSSQSK